jgi:hypothetical protein
MMTARTVAACFFALTIVGTRLEAQDLSRYRTFELGTDVAAVSAVTGVASSAVATVHQRPVLLQDLAWRPSRWMPGSTAESTDPVEEIVFSFYNGHLFRIVVNYNHDRTAGMTDADMIEAISAVYGPRVKPDLKPTRGSAPVPSNVEIESASPIAHWGDTEHAVALHRTSSYRGAFRLIVTDLAVADLARAGAVQALQLDAREAPQREIARQQKELDDARAAAEKARNENRGLFKP